MDKPQQQQYDDGRDASSMNDYAPKHYSLREHALMGLKIFLIIGALFGFLWLVNAAKAEGAIAVAGAAWDATT